MKILNYAAIFLGLLFLQIVILPFFSIFDIVPDAVLIGVIILAMREGAVVAMITAAGVGLVQDAFTTNFLGANMLALILAAFLAGIIFKQREKLNFQSQIIYLFVIIFIHQFLYFSLFLLNGAVNFLELIFRFALPAAVYTLILASMTHLLWPRGIWR